MEISSQIYVLVFLVICFGLYKILRRMSNKRNSKPLWYQEDEKDLNDILSRIYSSVTLENLKDLFAEGVRCRPRYHDLFKVAMEERHQQITQNIPVLSFEAKESKTRKRWMFAFCANYFLYWLSIVSTVFPIDSPNEEPLIGLAAIIPYTILTGIIAWIVYHCAYKKKGTGLLSWIVIMSPLLLIRDLAMGGFAKEEMDISMWCAAACGFALFGFYWFSSLRLRRINYEVKARRQLDGLRKNRCFSESTENIQTTPINIQSCTYT